MKVQKGFSSHYVACKTTTKERVPEHLSQRYCFYGASNLTCMCKHTNMVFDFLGFAIPKMSHQPSKAFMHSMYTIFFNKTEYHHNFQNNKNTLFH